MFSNFLPKFGYDIVESLAWAATGTGICMYRWYTSEPTSEDVESLPAAIDTRSLAQQDLVTWDSLPQEFCLEQEHIPDHSSEEQWDDSEPAPGPSSVDHACLDFAKGHLSLARQDLVTWDSLPREFCLEQEHIPDHSSEELWDEPAPGPSSVDHIHLTFDDFTKGHLSLARQDLVTWDSLTREFCLEEEHILDHSSEEQWDDSEPAPGPSIVDHTRLTFDDFVIHKVLGIGGFGKVFLAELKVQRDYFAVKAVKKSELLKYNNAESNMVERRVLAMAWDSPFLSHLYATFQTEDYLFFVMEYLPGGTLYFHIDQQVPKRFDVVRARFYSGEIISGLQFLHGRGILHRDLKSDNVMLDGDGHTKIVDFGLCKENMFGVGRTTSYWGTAGYMAPEMMKGEEYSYSVDWWSFGVLIYEMLAGDFPFKGETDDELLESISRKDMPIYPSHIATEARDLMEKLFDRDPEGRLGVVGNIRDHPFFNTINWAALERRELDPPFRPIVKAPNDCNNIDKDYLREIPLHLSHTGKVDSIDQTAFAGFSYVNAKMESLLEDTSRSSVPQEETVIVVQSLPEEAVIMSSSGQSCSLDPNIETGVFPWLGVGAAVLGVGAVIGAVACWFR